MRRGNIPVTFLDSHSEFNLRQQALDLLKKKNGKLRFHFLYLFMYGLAFCSNAPNHWNFVVFSVVKSLDILRD
ncbi:Hypothetical predicted protein [Octopus vulgaris]|uniref:Uncharacterized protein n=1 Tax=Octopus vulgaris TaxID=6645 RepID=A0AA36AF00_OCTVU|nr:Hypothetical predicted protein [Octopus vulgaris]